LVVAPTRLCGRPSAWPPPHHWGRDDLVQVELADNLADGWQLWMRFVEAGAAWDGTDAIQDQPDADLLLHDGALSFTRLVATAR
jgi:hypothetical protein